MVISNGTNPISLHHFSFCPRKFHICFMLSLQPRTQQTANPFLHSCIYLSHNPSLWLHTPLSVFHGNCFMALLVRIGRVPWVSGPVKGPSTLGPKPPFLSEFNTINSGMSQTHPIRFSVTSLLCLSQILIISMELLQHAVHYSKSTWRQGQHQPCSALARSCVLQHTTVFDVIFSFCQYHFQKHLIQWGMRNLLSKHISLPLVTTE